MQDGRHVDAASILTQYGRRQDMAAAEAVRMVEMLSECAQFCTGHSQDTVLLGIQMCRDAQSLAESAGLPPQQLLPVLLVRSPPPAPPIICILLRMPCPALLQPVHVAAVRIALIFPPPPTLSRVLRCTVSCSFPLVLAPTPLTCSSACATLTRPSARTSPR